MEYEQTANGKVHKQSDIEEMRVKSQAKHDEEKALLVELLASLNTCIITFELYRYHRFNLHMEVIVRAVDDWDNESLMNIRYELAPEAVEYDVDMWAEVAGIVEYDAFADVNSAVRKLWREIHSYVLAEDAEYRQVKET